MKTYERLKDYKRQHPEKFFDTTESLTNYLLELGYTNDKIKELLQNPITRDCVEINLRSSELKKDSKKKVFKKIVK